MVRTVVATLPDAAGTGTVTNEVRVPALPSVNYLSGITVTVAHLALTGTTPAATLSVGIGGATGAPTYVVATQAFPSTLGDTLTFSLDTSQVPPIYTQLAPGQYLIVQASYTGDTVTATGVVLYLDLQPEYLADDAYAEGIRYATVEEFLAFHGVRALGQDASVIDSFLRGAEEVVTRLTGGRSFLPVKPVLKEDLADGGAAATFNLAGASRLPSGSHILLGGEVLKLGPVTAGTDRIVAKVLSRGVGGTAPASHTAGTSAYMIRGLGARDLKSSNLYIGDFLQLVAMWTGSRMDLWVPMHTEYLIPRPQTAQPYQWLDRIGGWDDLAAVWAAAVYGYAWTVPEDIKRATLRIAQDWWLIRGTNATVLGLEGYEGFQRQYRQPTAVPPDVAEILQAYRRVQL